MMMQKADLYIKRFRTFSGIRLMSWSLLQLNILCTKSNHVFLPFVDHGHLPIHQPIRFHRNRVIHISKHSVLCQD